MLWIELHFLRGEHFFLFLLQTLAKVVDGWKKHESEKVAIINQLKIEQETAEQSQQRQQEVRIFLCWQTSLET